MIMLRKTLPTGCIWKNHRVIIRKDAIITNSKDADGKAGIYQPKLNVGLEISFDASKLDGFVEWKMMGVRDYVLGLECGNCYPDGRDVMRKTGMLKFLKPGEAVDYHVDIKLYQK